VNLASRYYWFLTKLQYQLKILYSWPFFHFNIHTFFFVFLSLSLYARLLMELFDQLWYCSYFRLSYLMFAMMLMCCKKIFFQRCFILFKTSPMILRFNQWNLLHQTKMIIYTLVLSSMRFWFFVTGKTLIEVFD
jgi:hypothetical protein